MCTVLESADWGPALTLPLSLRHVAPTACLCLLTYMSLVPPACQAHLFYSARSLPCPRFADGDPEVQSGAVTCPAPALWRRDTKLPFWGTRALQGGGPGKWGQAGWAAAGQARGSARVTAVPCQAVSRRAGAGQALLADWVGVGRAGRLAGRRHSQGCTGGHH